jgi:hypothetical protein
MSDWPAMKEWSLDWFAQNFAQFPVTAHAPQFPTIAKCSVKTTLGKYVDYLNTPMNGIDGEWVRGSFSELLESGLSLYVGNFNPAHPRVGRPKLIFKYVPEMPDWIDSWMPLLNQQFRRACEARQSHHFVYLSIPGGVTPLHHDFWETHAFLAQVSGRKRATLFSPEDMDLLYTDRSGDVRLMETMDCFSSVQGWRGDLCPGDFLIIPSKWLHFVETLEASITYSADWIDQVNWCAYVKEGLIKCKNWRADI